MGFLRNFLIEQTLIYEQGSIFFKSAFSKSVIGSGEQDIISYSSGCAEYFGFACWFLVSDFKEKRLQVFVAEGRCRESLAGVLWSFKLGGAILA